jgi:beta-glucosidase
MLKISALTVFIFMNLACATHSHLTQWPRTNSQIEKDPAIEKKVKALVESMSLEEKVAQMIQAEIKYIKPQDLKDFPLGSVLNGGGSFPYNNKNAKISDWVKLADTYYTASINVGKGIPLIWGTDAVHGHNNVIGATIFPHNIGLGAANNSKLIEKITAATAKEVLATGLDWIFAPTVAVVRNDRWGRTYEGYSEDPEIVKAYAGAAVKGLQGKEINEDHLIATAKHFIGDGGTENGVDQGNNSASEADLIRLHAQGYVTAINAGAQTVMASFNSWKGKKLHGHKYLLTDVLKKQMGFDGFVIGDWNGHGQVDGCSNESCPHAINAGVDMIMVPEDWKMLFYNTVGQVKSGEISMERINDAVTRILRVKMRYGIMELGKPSSRKHAGYEKLVGSKEHREIARQAVRESLVLLKNKDQILPLSRDKKILVTGSGADNIGKQSGGWSVTWQGTGTTNADFPGGTSIYGAIKKVAPQAFLSNDLNAKADVAIFVFGENPYAEGQGDRENLYYGAQFSEDLATLKKLKARGIPVISLFITGRPLWVNPELNQSDAFVVTWLPGTEADGITDVIFKKADGTINYDFKGRLSFSWPSHANQVEINRFDKSYRALFPYGYGLSYSVVDTLSDNLSEVPFPDGNAPGAKDEIDVFAGRPIAPFSVLAGKNAQKLPAGIGMTSDGSLRAIAIDKDVQEDARQIFIKSPAEYIFKTNSALNLSHYFNGGVSFDLRKDSHDLNLNVLVNQTKLDLNPKLNEMNMGEWTKIYIPFACLEARGVDIRALETVFGLSAQSGTFSLANIKLYKKSQADAYCE